MTEVISDKEFEQICRGELSYIRRRKTRLKVGQTISLYRGHFAGRIDVVITEVEKSFFKGMVKFNVKTIIGVD